MNSLMTKYTIMGQTEQKITGQIVDVIQKRIFQGEITIQAGKIKKIEEKEVSNDQFILPGFIDSHIHIESSMLIPSEFARLAMPHGTVASVSDPHEIANVLGIEGVNFMIEDGKRMPFKFNFGAPSCVPATPFETSGATLGVKEIEELMARPEIKYLSEMMNFPGVLFEDKEVMQKLEAAKKQGKPIDGHAPGVLGKDAAKYAGVGISTDHECFTLEEAKDKIAAGMKVQIREGSAAKNFEALVPLLDTHPEFIMFCSDDKHPDDLVEGHINQLIKRSLLKGYQLFDVLRACTLIPRDHYQLEVGMLQEGDWADLVIIDNLEDFNIKETFINGIKVAGDGKSLWTPEKIWNNTNVPNKFNTNKIELSDLVVNPQEGKLKVIGALDGELVTNTLFVEPKVINSNVVSNTESDVLKMIVYNRYEPTKPKVAFIHNFGFNRGAIASTVAHDSHNIIAVGVDDKDIMKAVNLIVDSKGGIALIDGEKSHHLALPVAGLMSPDNGYEVAKAYEMINEASKKLGSQLNAPFMTLSFMALLVIPELKLSDKGLFDGKEFTFTSLFETM